MSPLPPTPISWETDLPAEDSDSSLDCPILCLLRVFLHLQSTFHISIPGDRSSLQSFHKDRARILIFILKPGEIRLQWTAAYSSLHEGQVKEKGFKSRPSGFQSISFPRKPATMGESRFYPQQHRMCCFWRFTVKIFSTGRVVHLQNLLHLFEL